MGQNHQVYLRIPKIFLNANNPNNYPETTIGLHHPWLYGSMNLKLLKNFLTYVNNPEAEFMKYISINKSETVLKNAYSFMAEEGYFEEVDICNDHIHDFTTAPNHNGITVIDLTSKKPSYCFLSFNGLECLDKTISQKDFINFYPMNAEKWITLHYGTDWKTKRYLPPRTIESVEFFKSIKVITPSRLMRIFPKLKENFNKGMEEHKNRIPNSVKFIFSK